MGGLIGTLVLLVGVVLLGLQTETGATTAAQFLARQANPFPGTHLTVERASGNWVRSLRLTNVSLTRPDSPTGAPVPMAHVDTIAARYSLGALLRGRVHLRSLTLRGPSVTMRQAADSSWDWGRLLPPPAEPPDTSAGTPVRVDRVALSGGQFTADFYAGSRDSTARVRDVTLRGGALTLSPSIGGRLDTLSLRGQYPADTTTLRLAAAGALSPTRLRLDTLRLTSPRSRVRGHGSARLPLSPAESLDDVALTLRADPLVLGDLTTFVPGLDVNPREAVDLDARLTGSGSRLTLDADARFSGGGRVTAHAEATPRTEGDSLSYELNAQIDRLTTSLLAPLDATENTLTGTVSGTLRGPSPSALDGTVNARLTDTRLYGLHTPELTLQSTVRDGRADVDLRGVLNGTRLSVTGTGRPFDAAPSTDLTAQVRDLSLPTVAPAAGIEGTLSGTVQLRGRSMTTEAATYEANVTLASSQIGKQPIDSGQFSLVLGPDAWDAGAPPPSGARSNRLQFDGALSFPIGRLRVAGGAVLDGSERFALDRGRFEEVDVAALLGDTTASRLTGTFQAQGQGLTPEAMRGTATLTIESGRYGPHRLSTLKTTVRLDAGRLTTETSAQLNGGDWTFAVTGRPFDPLPSADITEGRFRNVDIGPFLRDSTQTSTLDGTFQGRVRGTSTETLQLEASLALNPSQINRQPISSASVDVSFREGDLRTDLALKTPEGSTQISAQARPFDEVPSYRITEGSFENLNVGALAGVPGLSTQLSGGVSLSGRGARLPSLSLTSTLTVENSSINQAPLSEGRLELVADGGRATADGRFSVAGGTFDLSGQIEDLSGTPSYTLKTTAQSIDVGALAGLDSLQAHVESARWTLKGRGTTLQDMTATTRFSTQSLRIARLQIDAATLNGRVERGLLTVDTLSVASNAVEGQGHGPVALLQGAGQSDFNLNAQITNAAPLRRLFGVQLFQLRTGRIEARVYGSPELQRFDGTAKLDGLIYDDVRIGDAQLSFNGQRESTQTLDRLEVEGTVGYLTGFGFTADRAQLEALYDGTTVDLSADVQFNPQHTVDLGATFRPATPPIDVHLDRLNLRLGPDRWSLLQPSTITVGETYRVDRLLLHSGSQQVAADGVVAPTGAQSLVVTIEAVRLGGIAPLVGFTGLDGTMTGTLAMTGTAVDPQIDGGLDLDVRSKGEDVGTLRLDVGYDDLTGSLDATLTHRNGSVLTANGSLPVDLRLHRPTPVDLSDRPVQLDVSTEQFPINWVDPFLDPATLRSVTGTLVGDATVRGTLDQPALSGTLSVTNAGAYLPTLETTYRNGSLRLRLANNQITLDEATLQTKNGGTLRATGTIDVPNLTLGEYNLSLTASDFLAIDTRAYRDAVVDGDVTLRGTTQRPALVGDLQVEGGSVYYAEALAQSASAATQVRLTPQDQLVLEERFGLRLTKADTTTFDFYAAAALDLSVELQRNTWLRSTSNPEMNVQLSGDLDVQKAHSEDARVFGTINAVAERSTIRQFGQEFRITEGTVTFNGDPATPYLNFTANYEQRARGAQGSEVQITLTLTGRPDELSPSLSSEPSMSTRNILSYLATGRPADEILSGDGEGGDLATQVALGQATNFVENLAASELGLDVVRLQVRPEGVSYLTVGRYLTPRFFASIEQPLTTSSSRSPTQQTAFLPDVTLEYQINDFLLLRSLSGQQSLQLNLLFEYAY